MSRKLVARLAAVSVILALSGAACGKSNLSQGAEVTNSSMTRAASAPSSDVPVITARGAATAAGRTGLGTTVPERTTPETMVPGTTAPGETAPETRAPVPTAVERSGANVDASPVVGDPLAIRIPSIGVESSLVGTGVLADGTVAVPPDANVAGWFELGPRPGDRGPAVIMGHVDSARTGPGVFYRLRDIEVGAIATVETSTGRLDFVVERVEQHPKLEFPTDEVYGPVRGVELRLITCGGKFDRSVRSYSDNFIVYLVPATP